MQTWQYSHLIERIRRHCQSRQWYGPDMRNILLDYEHRDGNGAPAWKLSYDFAKRFYPCATEEQVRLSEEAMGCVYPALLRTLYLEVGNGGFGPGDGLIGTFGGFRDAIIATWKPVNSVQESIVSVPGGFEACTLFDLRAYETHFVQPEPIFVDSTHWPTAFILLCDYGCGWQSYVHAPTGWVYYCGEGFLFRQADSLEAWIDLWLQGVNLEDLVLKNPRYHADPRKKERWRRWLTKASY